MYALGVGRQFRARHYLIGNDWGKENIEHPHHYRLELVLETKDLDQHGFLVDISELNQHLDEVTAAFEGRTLNSLAPFKDVNPSIERLATVIHHLFRERLAHCGLAGLAVTIWEDEVAWTSYRGPL
ncbi:MAG: 6-carboxytetrahydropterin synthase [Desulfurivibrionaceae bacterium]|nr:6-carboxytetrahydropterin synthase [Desulfurivibrionaceae bacterium]